MIVRQYAPCSLGRSIICLGKQGEINALRVEFDVSAWMAMYPDATVKLMHFAPDRPQDNPVIPTLGVEGTLRVWIVGKEDTAGSGNGVIELLLIDERTGSTIKSATGYTTVLRSPSAGIEAQDPEPGYVRYDVDQSALLTDTQKAFARTNIDAIKDEKDPTVPDWAKQPRKPTYTASEVGALPSSYTPPVTSVNGMTGAVALSAQDVGARPDTWTPSAIEVGADAAGTASGAVDAHNTSGAAHADLRALIEGLTSRLNALADSDDTTLDQLSEIVAYIKSNKALIDAVTTGKVSVSDIVDNLTTNASGKVLSAAQGVALKAMIDGIVIPTALPNPQPITINGQRYDGSEAVTVTTVEIDDTLTQSGKAADAKAVGDQLSALNEANAELNEDLDYKISYTGILNRFQNNETVFYNGRYRDGWEIVVDQPTWFYSKVIVLYKGDVVVANGKYYAIQIAKLDGDPNPYTQTNSSFTDNKFVCLEDGNYSIQGVFENHQSSSAELLEYVKSSISIYSLYNNDMLYINDYINKKLIYSYQKKDNETPAQCVNRMLEHSSNDNKPVVLDVSITVDEPIYMKKGSTLIGLNSCKTSIKATDDFDGEAIIIIEDINNAEISNISINGGCVYNWNDVNFSKLGAKTKGIIVRATTGKNVTYTRINNVSISLVNGIGLYIESTTYEGLYTNIEIKCCNERGIYTRGTDSNYSNFIIGNCNYNVDDNSGIFGCSLEGGNNNYENFKVYLSGKNAGVHVYPSKNNNYTNFNIQDCPYCGLFLSGVDNCNINSFVIDRCPIGIIIENSGMTFIQSQVTWTKPDSPAFSVYRSINNKGYIYANIISDKDSDKIVTDGKTIFGLMYKNLNNVVD